jgi:putative peptidoglycan lipid II flippase
MIGRLLSVGGFTALSRVAGFARDLLMAAILGAGPMSDALMVALRLPNHFRAIFAEGAFTAAFLPRYTAAATTGGIGLSSPASHFANDVFAWQFAAQMVLLLLALIFMPEIIALVAPGFASDPAQFELAVALTRITFPYLICVAIVTQYASMLNAIQRFKAAASAPILLSLSMIATLLLADHFTTPAHAAAVGVLVAGFLELLVLIWAASRAGFSLRLRLPRWGEKMGEFFRALGAATIGSGSVQIGLFIDTIIASFLPSGDLTSLYYADRINQLPMGIVGVALGTVLLPEMSARIAGKDERAASAAQNRAIVFGLLLTLPCTAAFLVMPDTIMRALFARGAFGEQAADTSAMALFAYGLGLPAFILLRCIVPSFYARGDTATPVRATVLSVIANIAMKIVLVWVFSFGAAGLALGTSFGAWVSFFVLVWLARRRGVLVLTPELKRAALPVAIVVGGVVAGMTGGLALGGVVLSQGGPLADEARFLFALSGAAAAFFIGTYAFRNRLPLRDALRRAKPAKPS